MDMNFKDAERDFLEPLEESPVCECEQCGDDIYRDDLRYEYDHECFCSKECVLQYLLDSGEMEEFL